MKKSALVFFFALAGCASTPPPKHLEREQVTKHFVVVVQEPDSDGELLTRSIAGGPVSLVPTRESAFATADPRYSVLVQWRGECLDVTVARSGLPPFDDFAAHGCVKLDERTKSVASVTGDKGAPIEVVLWLLET